MKAFPANLGETPTSYSTLTNRIDDLVMCYARSEIARVIEKGGSVIDLNNIIPSTITAAVRDIYAGMLAKELDAVGWRMTLPPGKNHTYDLTRK